MLLPTPLTIVLLVGALIADLEVVQWLMVIAAFGLELALAYERGDGS